MHTLAGTMLLSVAVVVEGNTGLTLSECDPGDASLRAARMEAIERYVNATAWIGSVCKQPVGFSTLRSRSLALRFLIEGGRRRAADPRAQHPRNAACPRAPRHAQTSGSRVRHAQGARSQERPINPPPPPPPPPSPPPIRMRSATNRMAHSGRTDRCAAPDNRWLPFCRAHVFTAFPTRAPSPTPTCSFHADTKDQWEAEMTSLLAEDASQSVEETGT